MSDEFYEPGPYAPMALGYDDDPKIAALAEYGDDAGLHRDLHLAMIRYASRARTDGLVRAIEVRRLGYPLSTERAEQLARNLAEHGLLVPLDSDGMAQAIAPVIAVAIAPAMWRIVNYERWNRTRAWLDARHAQLADAGRLGAHSRWAGHSPGHSRPHSPGYGTPHSPGTGTSTYTGTKTKTSPARAGAGAREDDDDDKLDELINTAHAALTAHGPITREQTAAWVRSLLNGKTVDDPRRYVVGALRHEARKAYREATAATPISSSRQPPATGQLCRRCSRTDHPTEQCPTLQPMTTPGPDDGDDTAHRGADAARKTMANRPAPETAVAPAAAELHGAALARAQAAASRTGRGAPQALTPDDDAEIVDAEIVDDDEPVPPGYQVPF